MRLGFIGTGALTAAIVTGLKSVADNDAQVIVSPRNEEISAGLARSLPDVSVAADNQAVLDQCDMVMLAVRPQVAVEVLTPLTFRADHHVVSLIATVSSEQVARIVAPATRITLALPMPMSAYRQGATIICPPDREVAALFGRVGAAIEVESTQEFQLLGGVTATFATFFTLQDTIHGWMTERGVPSGKARDYIAAIYKALASAPEKSPELDFAHLAKEYATRGGINEQVVRELIGRGVFGMVRDSLDNAHRRISGG
ncbi:MAG: pyrroline-5-carboxylate reductase [Rhizobiaceae bacterium]